MDSPAAYLKDAKVLIVDDTPANLDLLAEVLESHGCTVLAAPGGDVALASPPRPMSISFCWMS